jgi:hypothetical protein
MKMSGNIVGLRIIAVGIAAAMLVEVAAAADAKAVPGINDLYRLDLLPKLKSFESVGCVSSYDPTAATTTASAASILSSARKKRGLS